MTDTTPDISFAILDDQRAELRIDHMPLTNLRLDALAIVLRSAGYYVRAPYRSSDERKETP